MENNEILISEASVEPGSRWQIQKKIGKSWEVLEDNKPVAKEDGPDTMRFYVSKTYGEGEYRISLFNGTKKIIENDPILIKKAELKKETMPDTKTTSDPTKEINDLLKETIKKKLQTVQMNDTMRQIKKLEKEENDEDIENKEDDKFEEEMKEMSEKNSYESKIKEIEDKLKEHEEKMYNFRYSEEPYRREDTYRREEPYKREYDSEKKTDSLTEKILLSFLSQPKEKEISIEKILLLQSQEQKKQEDDLRRERQDRQDRLDRERIEKRELAEMEEKSRQEKLDRERIEKRELAEMEEKSKQERLQEKLEREDKYRQEELRLQKEKLEREDKYRQEELRLQKEKADRELRIREEEIKILREKNDKEEKLARQKQEQDAKEEKLSREKHEREYLYAEKAKQEKADRELRIREEEIKILREKNDKEEKLARQKQEQDAKEEKLSREKYERLDREHKQILEIQHQESQKEGKRFWQEILKQPILLKFAENMFTRKNETDGLTRDLLAHATRETPISKMLPEIVNTITSATVGSTQKIIDSMLSGEDKPLSPFQEKIQGALQVIKGLAPPVLDMMGKYKEIKETENIPTSVIRKNITQRKNIEQRQEIPRQIPQASKQKNKNDDYTEEQRKPDQADTGLSPYEIPQDSNRGYEIQQEDESVKIPFDIRSIEAMVSGMSPEVIVDSLKNYPDYYNSVKENIDEAIKNVSQNSNVYNALMIIKNS